MNSSEREREGERGKEHVRIVKEHQNILGEDNGDRQTDRQTKREEEEREMSYGRLRKNIYFVIFIFVIVLSCCSFVDVRHRREYLFYDEDQVGHHTTL